MIKGVKFYKLYRVLSIKRLWYAVADMKQDTLRTTFFLTLLAGVLVVTYLVMQPYLVTLAIAATAAVVFQPVYERLCTLYKGKETLAALTMVVLTFVLVLLPLTLIGIQIATEAGTLYQAFRSGSSLFPRELIESVQGTVQQYLPGASVNINQYAGQALNWVAGSMQSFFAGTVRAVLLLFLGTIAYFYMLRDGKAFVGTLMELSPLTQKEDENICKRLHRAINSVIRGSLIIAVLQGIVTGIGLALFGIPSAVLLGSVAGVGALIPTVGTTIVLLPVVAYLGITGEYVSAIGLTAWGALAVGMIDNFLHPLLVGRGMRMHPLFIFFAVIGGISYFGVSGIILGPLTMSLLIGLLDIFRTETSGKQ